MAVLNIGLSASITGIQSQVDALLTDIASFQESIALQATFIPPNPAAVAVGFTTATDPVSLALALNPSNFATGAASFNADLVTELGLIEAQLAVIGELVANFDAGLSSGDLAGWSYAGRAAGFGESLAAQTRTGFGSVAADDNINALVIATELFASWESFSLGFNVGDSADEEIQGPSTTAQNLTFLGTLGGGDWNTGLLAARLPIDIFLLELQAASASLQAQIQVSLGINLPPIDVLLGISANFDVSGLVAGLAIRADLLAQIQILQGRIDLLLQAITNFQLALSGGGLTLWVYGGPASEFGASFEQEVVGGLPNANGPEAPVYGLAIASQNPDAWASFGLIFKNAA